MSRDKKRNKGKVAVQDELNHNPFADKLLGLGADLPAGPDVEAPTPAMKEPSSGYDLSRKLVVRREKKGRGGKTVTRLEGVGADPEGLALLARTLGKALGARAFVEDGYVWVSGDQCQALQRWLQHAGATKIVIGN